MKPDANFGADTVHILCPVHNGAPFLEAFLASLDGQQHTAWILWAVDDGSSDDSAALLHRAAGREARIRVLPSPPARLGAAGAFAWLWNCVPADAQRIAFADQDDVWLPDKLTRSLRALCAAEDGQGVPVLVHTDLEVVGSGLEPIAPSFWRYAGIAPLPTSFRRLVAQNVATGCTMLMNRALFEVVGSIPRGVVMHDAWVACAAALTGCIVTVPAPTVRYRQHDSNTIGARASVRALPWRAVPARIVRAMTTSQTLRRQIAATSTQAALMIVRFAAHLSPSDREFLERYAGITTLPWLARKRAVASLHCHKEHGWLRNAGVIWRA